MINDNTNDDKKGHTNLSPCNTGCAAMQGKHAVKHDLKQHSITHLMSEILSMYGGIAFPPTPIRVQSIRSPAIGGSGSDGGVGGNSKISLNGGRKREGINYDRTKHSVVPISVSTSIAPPSSYMPF